MRNFNNEKRYGFKDKILKSSTLSLLAMFIMNAGAFAQEAEAAVSQIDKGDTAWILISTALVMLMTPGLALFYGGMVRSKNILGTVMQSFVALAVVTIVWVLWGYSLSFGTDINFLIGGFDYIGLRNVGMESGPYGTTIPHYLFMAFQLMFAIITPALITGAFAERFKFSSYLVFLVIWITIVYCPLAHWVWGGGWIGAKLKALDFAGGLVVHISSGAAALAAALIVGKRKGYGQVAMPPHNLVLTLLGAALLWFGWFGFNAGSALASNGSAANAFVVTHIASAAAILGWLAVEWIHKSKPTALGAASGAVAGLVAITPAAGFVGPLSSIAIGAIAGILCYFAVNLKSLLSYDDSLDVVGVHGVGGTWGAIATGLFASASVGGVSGLFFGNPQALTAQIISVIAAWLFAFTVTAIILKVLDMTMGLRVTEEGETLGLDLSEHGERGYS
ncbi:MAG TPA: ammonium transporter [Candidatus Gastranaerophilales bacterium]|nr:ammonium transporter [Candidatus Gastranaerophilales bacterium]